jgi:citrate synthase
VDAERDRPVDSLLRALVAKALQVDPAFVTDDLEFNSIAQWDSLGHVDLMLLLEDELGITISDEQTVELISYRAIKAFVEATVSAPPERRDVG